MWYQSEAELDRLEREYEDRCYRNYYGEEADEDYEEERFVTRYAIMGEYNDGTVDMVEETYSEDEALRFSELTEEDKKNGLVRLWIKEEEVPEEDT